jgi:arylsulfatase A-like enzyme
MIRRSAIFALVAGLLLHACAPVPQPQSGDRRRPLVVVLVVDQLRTDYLERYGSHLTGGLRRIMDEGAWFTNAAYPYLNTVTCAGHTTIGTGVLPYRHGMVLNAWWDREAARTNPCTRDLEVRNIGYTGAPTGGDSARAIQAPTLAERLRDRSGRSVSFSLKARSAIGLAGQDPTAILWFDERHGWTTSTAFTDAPIDWIRTHVEANPLEAFRGRTWERMLPESAYLGPDAGVGERTPSGWMQVFPHVLGQPAESLALHFQRSPFADEYLGRLAAHAVDTLDLGRGPAIDFLGVSFSTMDLVGHQYGPESHEVQDVLFRLDRTIGTLLEHLDARLGRDGYVLALSSDHGVSPIPEQSGAGRQPSSELMTAINTALEPFFGPGKYVAHAAYTDIYFSPGINERVRASREAMDAVLRAVRALPGMLAAYPADEVADAAARRSDDPSKRAAALNYFRGRSGDLIVIPRENWLLSSAAATHGTLHAYDQRVPVMFLGPGVPAGRRDDAATPADIAPTLAALAGFRFTTPDGRVLVGAGAVD